MENIIFIILILFLICGSYGLNLFDIKNKPNLFNIEKFTNYDQDAETPKETLYRLGKKKLDKFHKFNRMKEYLRRANYNVLSAEKYYKKYYKHPITPIKQNEYFKPHNNRIFTNIGNTKDKVLIPKYIKQKDMGSHVWYMVHDLSLEDVSHMHLPPLHYVVHG